VSRTYNDVAQALSHYSSLSPRTDVYSMRRATVSPQKEANKISQRMRPARTPSCCIFQAPFQLSFEERHTDFQ
jgi:hypothetical protein